MVLTVGLWVVDSLGAMDEGRVMCRWVPRREPRVSQNHRAAAGASVPPNKGKVSTCYAACTQRMTVPYTQRVLSKRLTNEKQPNQKCFFVFQLCLSSLLLKIYIFNNFIEIIYIY